MLIVRDKETSLVDTETQIQEAEKPVQYNEGNRFKYKKLKNMIICARVQERLCQETCRNFTKYKKQICMYPHQLVA